ncbi:MAG TPA: HD domain-containing phosphohydrolase [Lachnospiraceae bacterium]|jgi:HD-GYP domain-containing protein (c-di-GMP phosphodiesterase class II)|nr:HD domain-containing phosphohydrolase [Lachnospiraceae bacterium]
MEIISNKDICNLLTNTLKLIDKKPMEHGARVAYILLKMLQCKGGYVEYELADYIFLTMIHDIGAYKTEDMTNTLIYETKITMPHAIYGSLFLRYLSPMKDKAKILLYHHVDYSQLVNIDYQYKNITNFIGYAERVDLYNSTMGKSFDYKLLSKYENTKYSSEAIQLFKQAQIKYDVLSKLKSGEYLQELDEILGYIMFSNEEKKQYLELLMYTIGFRSEYAVADTVTTICICREMSKLMKICEEDMEKLYYATLLHDVGMLAISSKILDAPRALTQEELTKMRTHVNIAESILKQYLDHEIVEIAVAHHERSNGSGYYRGLKEEEMNTLQKILQIADTVTGMINPRSYRAAKSKDFVVNVLEDEANHGRFNRTIVKIFIGHYEKIMEQVHLESDRILILHNKLNAQYNQAYDNIRKV